MNNNYLFKLQNWICQTRSKNNIQITTLDNPGWGLNIDLNNTELIEKNFQKIKRERNENDWIFCCLNNEHNFYAACGPLNFQEVLKIFIDWANDSRILNEDSDDHFMWLSKWYFNQCDGDWEHVYGIKIETRETPGWLVEVELSETELENQPFQPTKIERSKENWVECCVEKNVFRGKGGLLNLVELVSIFYHWAKTFQTEQENGDFESDYDAFIKRKNARLSPKESI